MIKKCLTGIALLGMVTTAARAGYMAENYASFVIYDKKCESLPNSPTIKAMAKAVAALDPKTVQAGIDGALRNYASMGEEKFCAVVKMVIDQEVTASDKQMALQKKWAEEDAEKARVDNLPRNRLLRGYKYYTHVNFCHQERAGYLVAYISDSEMARAKKAIKEIADQAIKEDKTINTDEVWRQAMDSHYAMWSEPVQCQNALRHLYELSPTDVYSITKP